MSSPTRKGKAARLPFDVREAVNNMIRDGATAADLNAFIKEKGFAPLNGTNWTNWRKGGHQDWLKEQTRIEAIRAKHETIRRELAAGGFSVLDKAICEVATDLADSDLPANVIASSIAALKTAVTSAERVDVARERAEISKAALDIARKRFQRETCALFVKWHEDQRASEIAAAPGVAAADKIERLGQLIFKEDW